MNGYRRAFHPSLHRARKRYIYYTACISCKAKKIHHPYLIITKSNSKMNIVSLSLSVQVSKFSFNSLVGKSCWPSNDTTSFSSGNNSGWQRIKLYIYKRRIVLLPLEEVKRKRNSVFITGGIPSSRRGGLAKRIGQAEYLSCLFMSGRRDGMAGGGGGACEKRVVKVSAQLARIHYAGSLYSAGKEKWSGWGEWEEWGRKF